MKKPFAFTPKKIDKAEAMKKVRTAIGKTNTVVDVVGQSMDGGYGDAWALGFLLQLEAIGLIEFQ
jgi:hypothetical protein